jgi:hypothetical protein
VFSGGFGRSGLFGLLGVFVVAGIVVVIALSTGEGQSNPKTTYALIFGVLAVFFVVLFALQRSDMEKVATGSVRGTERAVAEGGRAIENPATMSEPELWAALAVKPIDDEAVKARGQMWDSGRRSLRLGMIVTLLIFLTVPSIYLFESFLPLLIGGPLIAIAAVYGSVRALMPGGDLDSGYEKVGRAMAPLGLAVTERPKVSIEMREPVTPRMGPKVRGALVLSGERHDRQVSLRMGGGTSEVTVRVAAPEFKAKSRDDKVRPPKDAPAAIAEALSAVPSSTRWKKLTVEGGPEGIVVARKGMTDQSDALCDLWLAERLADAV